MNIHDYISSGIIESYVMGMATAKEREEFERLSQQYPELAAARIAFEQSLEDKAIANASDPPPLLKEKIWQAIQEEMRSTTPVIPITQKKKIISPLKWIAAAAVLVIIIAGYTIWNNYNQSKVLENELAKSKDTLQQLDARTRQIEDRMLEGTTVKQVKVSGPSQVKPPVMNVYWDSTNTNVYMVIQDLAILPVDEYYELWSFTKGEKRSMGVFNSPADNRLILKMNAAQQADSFAITVMKK